MEIKHNSWEWTSVRNKNGGYDLVRADPETRAKQLQEYKEKREKELLKELSKLEMLH
jgi:hypothetical protein